MNNAGGMPKLDEPILPDDYPVYAGYCYVADGNVIISELQSSVAHLKRYLDAKEIRRCDIFGREKMEKGNG